MAKQQQKILIGRKHGSKIEKLAWNTLVEVWGSEDGGLIVELCFAEPAAAREKYKKCQKW